MQAKLGTKYTDRIHGIEGTAIARAEYLYGCSRVLLEWPSHDGKEVRSMWFDEPQLAGLEDSATRPGGPQPAPTSRDAPR